MDANTRGTVGYRSLNATEDIEPRQATPPGRAKKTTREHFTEGTVPAQFKLPNDLVTSLKLHAIQTGRTMSDIVLECLTSDEMVAKAWISSKRAA